LNNSTLRSLPKEGDSITGRWEDKYYSGVLKIISKDEPEIVEPEIVETELSSQALRVCFFPPFFFSFFFLFPLF